MRNALIVAVALAVLCTGCGDDDYNEEVPGTVGETGEGVFRYDCVSNDGDPRCNITTAIDQFLLEQTLGIEPELPQRLAVGARFRLSYLGDTTTWDGERLAVDCTPVRRDLVTVDDAITIERAGRYSFLARSSLRRVADFVTVEAADAAHLVVWSEERSIDTTRTAMTLPMRETAIAVVPISEEGEPLAGALPYTWSTSDPSVVSVTSMTSVTMEPVDSDEVRLIAGTSGVAIITVTLTRITRGELSRDITVVVP